MRWLIPIALLLLPGAALAHASEQGFVLLLPTGYYTAGGLAAVLLTLLVIAMVPHRAAARLFRPRRLWPARRRGRSGIVSLLSLAVLLWAIWRGIAGSQDPTVNALPLLVWGAMWLFAVTLQGLAGDIWRAVNPWTGLWRMAGAPAPFSYPRWLGRWPAVLSLVAFAGFLLADIAPARPERLAVATWCYLAFHMAGLLLFGLRWLLSAEALTLLMRSYAGLSARGRAGGRQSVGLPGWRWMNRAAPGLAWAVFMVLVLAFGSFDGVNETFQWLAFIGINPLEFTGRSAVVGANIAGLATAGAGLLAVFAGTLWLGGRMAGGGVPLSRLFRALAPSLLPIALAYHIAHYLPSMLVEGQYLAILLNDPFRQGWQLLGLAAPQVTTGFFNTQATVHLIFGAQAGVVVAGHVIAILMAHVIALGTFGTPRRAFLSQLPLAVFMIAYTVFGLWLLAAPRGA